MLRNKFKSTELSRQVTLPSITLGDERTAPRRASPTSVSGGVPLTGLFRFRLARCVFAIANSPCRAVAYDAAICGDFTRTRLLSTCTRDLASDKSTIFAIFGFRHAAALWLNAFSRLYLFFRFSLSFFTFPLTLASFRPALLHLHTYSKNRTRVHKLRENSTRKVDDIERSKEIAGTAFES